MTDAERIEAIKAKMAILNLTPKEVLQAVYRMAPNDIHEVAQGLIGFSAPPHVRHTVSPVAFDATYTVRTTAMQQIAQAEEGLRQARNTINHLGLF